MHLTLQLSFTKKMKESDQMDFRSKDDVLSLLIDLDYYCKENNINGEIVVLGGSALLTYLELNQSYFRPTMDIDVNIIETTNEGKFRELLQSLQIDIVGGIMEVPPLEDLGDHEKLIMLDNDFEVIKVYIPKIELLACTKIFSDRGKDLEDLENYKILENCNKEKLLEMVEEYKVNLLNPTNPDLNVHQLDRLLKEKGI